MIKGSCLCGTIVYEIEGIPGKIYVVTIPGVASLMARFLPLTPLLKEIPLSFKG